MQLLKLKPVQARYPKSKSSLYAAIAAGLFPTPVPIGARAVAWPESEVDAVIAARIAGKSDAEIRALVERLEVARAGVSGERGGLTRAAREVREGGRR